MIFYFVIDFKDGNCVCLLCGDMEVVIVFGIDFVVQVKVFQDVGVQWLYLVDLNGVFEGYFVNVVVVEVILVVIDILVQLGGGICDMVIIESWLECGLVWVILGIVVVEQFSFVCEVVLVFLGKIVVGIDVCGGWVVICGWVIEIDVMVVDLVCQFEDVGVLVIIYIDIDRDGVMQGLNIVVIEVLVWVVNILVIVLGGVSLMQDLLVLCDMWVIVGVILGWVLYDGVINLGEVLCVLV